MREYCIRRLLMLPPVLFLLSLLIFGLMRLLPGDVVTAQLGDRATQADIEQMRRMLGLDAPFHEQYLVWISHVIRGDLGNSLLSHQPVMWEIQRRIPVTAEYAIIAVWVGLILAIPLGVVSAVRQNSIWDFASRLFAIGGLSIPMFWTATMLLLVTSLYFKWVPPTEFSPFFQDPLTNLQQVGVAALIGCYTALGAQARMTRSSLLEVLRQDYIRTAWAKGLKERLIILRHALRNAMIPVISLSGVQFAYLLGGAVVMETIFALPGIGRLMILSIANRDYPVVQGVVIVVGIIVVVVNILIDLTYAWFDPRIRYH